MVDEPEQIVWAPPLHAEIAAHVVKYDAWVPHAGTDAPDQPVNSFAHSRVKRAHEPVDWQASVVVYCSSSPPTQL